MSTSTLDHFKVAIVTGGAGGLGKAMAAALIKEGKKVILVGRTASKLEDAKKDLGESCIDTYTVDVEDLSSLEPFYQKVIKEHPEVDCLINNAGVQKLLKFTSGIDFKQVQQEVSINILALVQLCSLFAAHFSTQKSAVVMNVTSGLAYVPINPVPVYCATKAFVKSFTLSYREQLSETGIKVVEIAPPLVESDLHREHADPDNNKKNKNSMSLTQDEFIKDVLEGWQKGNNEVGAGMSLKSISAWNNTFGGQFKAMQASAKAMH